MAPKTKYTPSIISAIKTLARIGLNKLEILQRLPDIVDPCDVEACKNMREGAILDLAYKHKISITRTPPTKGGTKKDEGINDLALIRYIHELALENLSAAQISEIVGMKINFIYKALKKHINHEIKKMEEPTKPKKPKTEINVPDKKIRGIFEMLNRNNPSLYAVEKAKNIIRDSKKTPSQQLEEIIKDVLYISYEIKQSVKDKIVKIYLS